MASLLNKRDLYTLRNYDFTLKIQYLFVYLIFMFMKKHPVLVVIICLILSFTFCKKIEPVIDLTPGSTQTPAGKKSPPVNVNTDKSNFKKEFLTQINAIRAQGCNCGNKPMPPVPPLSWNDQLESAAAAHANDMAFKKYFSHISLDGRTMKDRMLRAGYDFSGYRTYAIGENIAFGQRSINEVMQGWIKSPGHCENLMNPRFKEVGVAEINTYWVQDFGSRIRF